MSWRWRGVPFDLLLAAAGVGLDLLMSGQARTADLPPHLTVLPLALLVGAPMGFVRRWPLPTALWLSAALVLTDRIEAFSSNTAQMLLLVAVGVTAYSAGRRALAVAVGVAGIATGINLADPGVAFNAWLYAAGITLFPAIVGGYLRGSAGRPEHRDITPDVLLAAGGVAHTVLSTWTSWHAGGRPAWAIGLLAVAAGLALGVARRLPGLVFLFQAVLLVAADAYLTEAVNTCLVLTLVALGVFAMRVASWTWTSLAYLATCVLAAVAVVGPGTEVTAFRAAVLCALVVTPVAIGRYLGVKQAATAAERLRASESTRLTVAQVRADQLAERERIARDVHDIVAHHVGAMVLRASAARYTAPDGPVADALTDIRETGHQVLQDLRGLIDLLRDPDRQPGLLADPADVVRESAERMAAAGLVVDLTLDPDTAHASLIARTSAARIVQEGLTNVLKHAGPGTKVRVCVCSDGDGLAVEIRNGRPPTGIERLPSSGRGLAGMRERVKALGGTLTAGPVEDGGWLLAASLPATRGAA
ncbi:sensor histidine kinase [Nonomuraea glycinis]|jgi:signal transduction histidine kinase|uniref:sensor histidine kinase n=1 Tax=Nonomuraea glycinis TaxID=2047744 RepID=UPI002E0DB31E|nr:histidine kinase [Nonomuraea glycinis]